MLRVKTVSSLEKAFADQSIDEFKELRKISALRGERVAFQILHTDEKSVTNHQLATFTYGGELSKFATVRTVMNVPVMLASYATTKCDNFLRKTPGMYPDVLIPMHYENSLTVYPNALGAIYIEIDIPKEGLVGECDFTAEISYAGKTENLTFTVEIIDAEIPENELYVTQWFHCDCLAQYYDVPVWSEEHWRIVESFVKVAVKNGINLLLTPVFTPPLDTKRGGERLTNQLVGISVDGGKYSFDFTLLERWIEMCNRCGVKYFEIAHFFTQWGAEHAPKIMATVDGEYKKIFGWETDAHGEEYREFLNAFIPALLKYMRARGDDGRCLFHVSDEPTLPNLESYKKSKAMVADLLRGYTVMDALSNYDFYRDGIVSTPIPANNHISPFIENKTPNLWTYYCCAQGEGVSNRFIAMPGARTRSIGMQMYKYDIVGFLQWGYNYYNNRFSVNPINPYLDQSGDNFVPAGDMYSVYPAEGGEAYESLRICTFFEALQDVAAMKLCEKYYNKEEIVAAIERAFGGEIRFDVCAARSEEMHAVRECVNEMIKKKVNG